MCLSKTTDDNGGSFCIGKFSEMCATKMDEKKSLEIWA